MRCSARGGRQRTSARRGGKSRSRHGRWRPAASDRRLLRLAGTAPDPRLPWGRLRGPHAQHAPLHRLAAPDHRARGGARLERRSGPRSGGRPAAGRAAPFRPPASGPRGSIPPLPRRYLQVTLRATRKAQPSTMAAPHSSSGRRAIWAARGRSREADAGPGPGPPHNDIAAGRGGEGRGTPGRSRSHTSPCRPPVSRPGRARRPPTLRRHAAPSRALPSRAGAGEGGSGPSRRGPEEERAGAASLGPCMSAPQPSPAAPRAAIRELTPPYRTRDSRLVLSRTTANNLQSTYIEQRKRKAERTIQKGTRYNQALSQKEQCP